MGNKSKLNTQRAIFNPMSINNKAPYHMHDKGPEINQRFCQISQVFLISIMFPLLPFFISFLMFSISFFTLSSSFLIS